MLEIPKDVARLLQTLKDNPKKLNSLPRDKKQKVENFLRTLGKDKRLSAWVESVLGELASTGESESYEKLINTDYLRNPVDFSTFCNNEEFIGKYGKSLYPKLSCISFMQAATAPPLPSPPRIIIFLIIFLPLYVPSK